jgi:hypothetical protein
MLSNGIAPPPELCRREVAQIQMDYCQSLKQGRRTDGAPVSRRRSQARPSVRATAGFSCKVG